MPAEGDALGRDELAGVRAGWLTAELLDDETLFDPARSLELVDDEALGDVLLRLIQRLASEHGHELDEPATRARIDALGRPELIGATVHAATSLGQELTSS